MDQGHDDIAVARAVTLLDHHIVTVEDTRFDHRIAAHLQHVTGALAEQFIGHPHQLRPGHRLDGASRRDDAEQWDALLVPVLLHQPDAPLQAIQRLHQPGPHQGLDLFVQRAAGFQPQDPAQLIVGGRMLEAVDMLSQGLIDLLLATG